MSLELRKEIQAENTNVEASTYGTPYISGLEEDASVKEREKKYRRNSQRGGGKSREFGVREVKQSLRKKGVVNNVECC